MNYSGIDQHSNNSVVTVIDETDRILAEKRMPNELARIMAWFCCNKGSWYAAGPYRMM